VQLPKPIVLAIVYALLVLYFTFVFVAFLVYREPETILQYLGLTLFMLPYALIALWCSLNLLAIIAGKEHLQIGEDTIVIERQLGFMRRSYVLPIQSISRVHAVYGDAPSWWTLFWRTGVATLFNRKVGKLRIDSQLKTFGYGQDLEDAELRLLMTELEKRGLPIA
jgi:hypothetical protein